MDYPKMPHCEISVPSPPKSRYLCLVKSSTSIGKKPVEKKARKERLLRLVPRKKIYGL